MFSREVNVTKPVHTADSLSRRPNEQASTLPGHDSWSDMSRDRLDPGRDPLLHECRPRERKSLARSAGVESGQDRAKEGGIGDVSRDFDNRSLRVGEAGGDGVGGGSKEIDG